MKKILSISLLVLISFNIVYAQTQPLYFDNVIIIKYESEDNLSKNNLNNIQAMKVEVENFLLTHGLTEVSPIWSNLQEKTFKQTLNKKRKSLKNIDLTSDIRRIYEYKYSDDIDPKMLARKISNMPGIEYAEPKLIRTTIDIQETNDPIKNAFETLHKFDEAWDITTGSGDVIIGIVDSGVNYKNHDLKNKGWVNEDEIPDNGIDDDENGFIDDYIGWDFWESGGFNSVPITSDNDPFSANSDHGAHVAGIATAEANNSIGIVGSGYDSKYMAIKAGGIVDDPNTPDVDESRFVGFGYSGILYGVANGADIINNSWGGAGESNTEAEVIDLALNAGVVIIAAQGNSASTDFFSPASYDGVLGVGSLTNSAFISNFSNYGYTVDVFAQGSFVQSVVATDSSSFGSKSGTSMASPVVAGLAGLLKAQYPDWSPRRIIHQIRSTSVPFESDIDPLLLGKGMIDAKAALSTPMPGLSMRDYEITDKDGTSLSVGETGIANLTIKNYGEPTSNLVVRFEVLQEDIIITSDPINVGTLDTDTDIGVQVRFDIPEDYDLNVAPTFVIRFEDDESNYTDFDVFQFDNLNYGIMEANDVRMSFGANGTIGFSDPSEATGGIGFIPQGFSNILYEAGIMMMAGGNPFTGELPKLSNNLRSVEIYDSDFSPEDPFFVENPGVMADSEGKGTFSTNRFAELKDLDIELNTAAFQEDAVNKAVYSHYRITNKSDQQLEDFYFGIFTDWDVDTYSGNNVLFDSENNFMYIYDATNGSTYPYVAVDAMQATSSNLAIDNAYEGSPNEYQFRLYDGYSDEEKRNSLVAENNNTSVIGTDASTVVASGPYDFNPNVTIKLGFIYVYGDNYEDLKQNILAARSKYVFSVDEPGVYISSELDNSLPSVTKLEQNYPNPFNPTTEINFQLSNAGYTEIGIYNILGQKIQTLVSEVKSAGYHSINFDATSFNSGIYFAVLQSGDYIQTIKMTLIK
jgi:subtilisin family serine protease